MKIKRFDQIDEGVREFLKPKSKTDIIKKFKDDMTSDCNTILQYINNIQDKYKDIDNINLSDFLKDVVKLEIFYKIINDNKHENYNFNNHYYRRLGYLLNASGIEKIELDYDNEEEEGEEE